MALGMEAMGSAAMGAGASMGPVGALAGAGIGAGASVFDTVSQKKEREKQRKREEEAAQSIPGRRKASRLYDAFKDQMQQRFQSMASLSQAAMDWAQLMR